CGGVLVDREGVNLGRAIVINKQIGFECGLQRFQQSIGHRSSSKSELAYGANVSGSESPVVNEVVIERRYEIEVSDLLCSNKIERSRGVEARQAHECSSHQGHCEQ